MKAKNNRNKMYYTSLLLLRCPHCNKTPLLKEKSWFDFREGCELCDYKYERDEGYFWGAPFMLNYPITATIGIIAYLFLEPSLRDYDVYYLSGILSVIICAAAMVLFPYAKALWMFLDHFVNPIHPEK